MMRSVFTISCFFFAAAACNPQWATHRADAGRDAESESESDSDGEEAGADASTPEPPLEAGPNSEEAGTTSEQDGSPSETMPGGRENDAGAPRDAGPPASDGGCADGYVMREGTCQDIDECFEGTHACHMTAACENTQGSYDCKCALGYSGGTSAGFACAPRIVVGDAFGCALLSDGRVKCWGRNAEGQLGDGTQLSRSTPVFVKGLDRVVAIVAHDSKSACALRDDGRVVCWGDNASGQLGDGTVAARPEFGLVPNVADVVALSVRNTLACAVTRNGSLLCWGSRGQSGTPGVTTNLTPVQLMGAPPLASVEVGWQGSGCAVSIVGTVWCWSVDQTAQLTQVAATQDVVQVALGAVVTCVLQSSRNVVCWARDVTRATEVYHLRNPVSLSLGLEYAYAVQQDGALYLWLGLPDSVTGQYAYTTEPIDAVVVAGGGAGSPVACAAARDGTVRCWGSNSSGQLGDGTNGLTEIDTAAKVYKVTTVKDLDLW
jgi:Calcium-binding EGF domain/Regulator of chromosome condensation (RCC1) repeat